MIVSRRFQAIALVIAAAIGLGTWRYVDRQQRRDALALTLIEPSEIEISELRIDNAAGADFNVTGKIKNSSSRYTLSSVKIEILSYDCSDTKESADCPIGGQSTLSQIVSVPPGQVRALSGSVRFPDMPKPRQYLWGYSLAEIRAEVE